MDNPGVIQSELARALSIERSNIVLIVDDLVGRGWITRNSVPYDRRAYALRATSEGLQRYRTAVKRIAQHEMDMLGELTADERRLLFSVLDRIGQVRGDRDSPRPVGGECLGEPAIILAC